MCICWVAPICVDGIQWCCAWRPMTRVQSVVCPIRGSPAHPVEGQPLYLSPLTWVVSSSIDSPKSAMVGLCKTYVFISVIAGTLISWLFCGQSFDFSPFPCLFLIVSRSTVLFKMRYILPTPVIPFPFGASQRYAMQVLQAGAFDVLPHCL